MGFKELKLLYGLNFYLQMISGIVLIIPSSNLQNDLNLITLNLMKNDPRVNSYSKMILENISQYYSVYQR